MWFGHRSLDAQLTEKLSLLLKVPGKTVWRVEHAN
jgi:hypothetical protein